MARIGGIRRWFRLPSSPETAGRDVDEEIAFHLESRVEELMASGLSREAAELAARRRFGDVASARAELLGIDGVRLRRERRAAWWDAAVQEGRLAARGLRRAPGFTAAVVLMLGLGIGVNAAMFGLADRLLLSAPPHVADADRLVRVMYQSTPSYVGELQLGATLPYADYAVQRDEVRAFAGVGAYSQPNQMPLGHGPDATEAAVATATPDFFETLGVQPALGRFFSAAEGAPPVGERVVVLGHGFWRRRFGADPTVLGREIELQNATFTIIGVAPRGFHGIDPVPVEAWIPVSALPSRLGEDWENTRAMAWLAVVARLSPDASIDAAAAEATAAYLSPEDYQIRYRDDATARVVLGSIIAARAPAVGTGQGAAQRSGRIAGWLLGVSAVVLLIACLNVANLLLARVLRRRREIGVRLAIGVTRRRLAGQVVVEAALIALAGGMLGILLAHWGTRAAGALLLPGFDWSDATPDRRVLLFAAATAFTSALLAGVLPALHSARSGVAGLLGGGTRGGTYRRSRLRSGLVMLQAALSVLLLVGAGLFVRSLHNARLLPLGYEPDRVVLFDWQSGGLGWERDRALEVYDRSLERLEGLPHVATAALSLSAPMWSAYGASVQVPGRDSVPRPAGMFGYMFDAVSPRYFETYGTRVLQGRGFTDADLATSQPVAVITESMARLLWPGENALGKCFIQTTRGSEPPCREVVGIVESPRYRNVDAEPDVLFFVPLPQVQFPYSSRVLAVRTRGDPALAIGAIRAALHELGPALPHVRATLLSDRLAPQLQPWRLGATLFSAFGVLALVLAGLGLYGVVSYDVTQRTRELGVRMALGARARNVLALVLGDAFRVVAAGLLLGLLAALWAAPRVEGLLFDVAPRDARVFTAVSALLLVVGIAAALLPGWRASTVPPTEALREDG